MAPSYLETSAHVPDIPGVSDLMLIGRGGSGMIYRGRQDALSRDVAVKVLATPAAPGSGLERWKRELNAMGRLSNHPNIVAVYDSGLTEQGLPYLVMPFIPDGSLGDRVRRSGPLPSDEVVAIGVKLASALTAAHGAGVLHRDVKPDNVLLAPYGPQLADFGIARLADSTTTATAAGEIHATINYAAPEVLAGESASEASDVYGLAATLYTALQGDVPFPHTPDATPVAVMYQIIHDPAPDLRDTGVPPEVASVIASAMAKDPLDRPGSAAALGRALDHAAALPRAAEAGPPLTERIVTRTEVASPSPADAAPARRRRAGLLVGLLAVAVAVAAALFVARSGDRDGSQRTTGSVTTPTAVRVSGGQTVSESAAGDAARRYFSALGRGDYGGAYDMLSPGFKTVQSRAAFETFWRSASPVVITGDLTVRGLVASVPIQMGGGRQTYALTLARGNDGRVYVDGPRPR